MASNVRAVKTDERLHIDLAVEARNLPPRRFRLRQSLPRVCLVKQHLPLQIALFHKVPVDQRQRPPSRSRQQARRRRARRANAHDCHVRPQQLFLPPGSNPLEECLPRVPFR